MTCEDCLYYKFCSNQYGDINYFDVENYCGVFEDKSKYIKLPCKVGDTVYLITKSYNQVNVESGIVEEIYINDRGFAFNVFNVSNGYPCITLQDYEVFFTKEEAEVKLKELTKNEN